MNATNIFAEANNKHTKSLFKSFLILIEDLHRDHEINFSKLRGSVPDRIDLINQADYFDEEKLKYLRKKILDMGNEVIRNKNSDLENFTISFKF